jgi:ribonuclease H / adenosylcobalamin/alpha-ribazole phosphatase
MAEYGGLLLGLEGVANREYKSYNPMQALSIEGDSQLVIRQLTGEYECKHKNLKPLCAKAKKLIKKFEEEGTIVTLQHIHGYLSRREPSR